VAYHRGQKLHRTLLTVTLITSLPLATAVAARADNSPPNGAYKDPKNNSAGVTATSPGKDGGRSGGGRGGNGGFKDPGINNVGVGCTTNGAGTTCPNTNTNNNPGGGQPAPTPAQLAQQALAMLHLPSPQVKTAPPRGRNGLVGLPEWVWVPAGQWKPKNARAQVGAVWAQVTATPQRLVINPGGGQAPVGCPDAGTAYDDAQSAGSQSTDCSVTYTQPSTLQPGGAYAASVQAIWHITWVGSGGAGGDLGDLTPTTNFPVRIAEAPTVNN
jgi:hypothetical protein